MVNLWIIFTTGLLAGGISCAAVQGGLLATAVATAQTKNREAKNMGAFAEAVFVMAKLIAHIIWGGILGGIGSVFTPSILLRGSVVMVLSVYMLGVGLALADVHPFFRRFLIQTPRFLGRFVRNTAKGGEWFTPAALGFLTVLIPCGVTQAMMAQSLSSGSVWNGALILGVFVAGTTPLFLVIGLALSKLGETMKNNLQKAAAVVICSMALWTFNSGLVMTGSPVNGQAISHGIYCALAYCEGVSETASNVIQVEINATGYAVDHKVIKAGDKITLQLVNRGGSGCQQDFTIPSLNISKIVPPGTNDRVEFTAPDKPGTLAFSCGMGMYGGQFRVVD